MAEAARRPFVVRVTDVGGGHATAGVYRSHWRRGGMACCGKDAAIKKMKRLAFVIPAGKASDVAPSTTKYRAFFEELNRLGYVEGQNLIIERYSAEGQVDHYSELARNVVSTNPDVIYTLSNILVLAFKANTKTIPIVAYLGDPVASGIVFSLAHPRGNITGVSSDAGYEISGKRLELLLEAIPKPSNVKELVSRKLFEALKGITAPEVARRQGISVTEALLQGTIDEAEYRRVFAAMVQDHVDALLVAADPINFSYNQLIVDLATNSRIPAIYAYSESVELGGLMAYSINISDGYRRIANIIDQILRGAKPADLPVEQPTKFEFVINMKTAKALGLMVPPSLLARADEVIE
jgi:putative tryptophan/tyrosine transport system substrate-binding protein